MEKFRQKLHEFRKENHITAKEMAQLLDMPYEKYTSLEYRTNHRITFELCKKLVNVFDINITKWLKDD